MTKAQIVNELKKIEFLVLNVDDREILDLWNHTHETNVTDIEEAGSCRKVIVWAKALELRVRIEMDLED